MSSFRFPIKRSLSDTEDSIEEHVTHKKAHVYKIEPRRLDFDDICSTHSRNEEHGPTKEINRRKIMIDDLIKERESSCQGWTVCPYCAKLLKEKSVSKHGKKKHLLKEEPATGSDSTDEKNLKDYILKCRSLQTYANHNLAKTEPVKKTEHPLEPFKMSQFNDVFLSKNMYELMRDYEEKYLKKNQKKRKNIYLKSAIIVLTWFTPENDAKTFKFKHLKNLRLAGDVDSKYYLTTRAHSVDISKAAAAEHLLNFNKFLIYLCACSIEDVEKIKSEILPKELHIFFMTFQDAAGALKNLHEEETNASGPLDHILILHSPLMLNFVREFEEGNIEDLLETSNAENFFLSLVLTRLFILQGRGNGDLLKLRVKDFHNPLSINNDFISLKISAMKNAYIHLGQLEYKMVSHYLEFIRPPMADKEECLFFMKSEKCITTAKINLMIKAVAEVALDSYYQSSLLGNQQALQRISIAKKKLYTVSSMKLDLELSKPRLAANPLEVSLKEARGIKKYFMPGNTSFNKQDQIEIGDTMFKFVAVDKQFGKLLTEELWNGFRAVFEMTADECPKLRFRQLCPTFEETTT